MGQGAIRGHVDKVDALWVGETRRQRSLAPDHFAVWSFPVTCVRERDQLFLCLTLFPVSAAKHLQQLKRGG